MNKEIGSYFSVVENIGLEYHENSIRLNTARNAIEYILKVKKYTKVYIPYFICDAVLEPIKKLKIDYKFYNINDKFEIESNLNAKDTEAILIVNYYGLKTKYIKKIASNYKNIIIDNTQAFFSKFDKEYDTVYSCRKFFPVSDGAYLYTDKILNQELETNFTYSKIEYFGKRFELGSNSAYEDYSKNEEILCNKKIEYMSKLTQNSMKGYDYEKIKLIRERNFLYLHNYLGKYNELTLEIEDLNAPLAYPFLIKKDTVREKLREKKIYLATYWPEVLKRNGDTKLEKRLAKYILPLPIDHRYSLEDMKIVIGQIKKILDAER